MLMRVDAMMRFWFLGLVAALSALALTCTIADVDYSNKHCEVGSGCPSGFSCDAASLRCVPASDSGQNGLSTSASGPGGASTSATATGGFSTSATGTGGS